MSQATHIGAAGWTAVDLVERFGAIPLYRIIWDPEPGTATESNVVELDAHQDRLCELLDGVLVQKTVGIYESYLAGLLASMLFDFVCENHLGITLAASGMYRLAPDWCDS